MRDILFSGLLEFLTSYARMSCIGVCVTVSFGDIILSARSI